ncbi:hypothetical protein ACFT9M_25465 [Micromonospora purpureochromogenes]|uniref:hypothetical protein n=1 Tax=Micromonospora purpureochromogenes TaxID=47872 RepID=UPI003636F88B
MREPENAAGRPPAPQETATNAISQIESMIAATGVIDEVPAHPRGGDLRRRHRLRQMFGRRRVSRELDDLLGIIRPVYDVTDIDSYAATGLNLGVAEREQRAGVTR